MTDEQYAAFSKTLKRYLKSNFIPYTDDDGVLLFASGQPETGYLESVAIQELARNCVQAPVADYTKVLKDFFHHHRLLAESSFEIDGFISDFERVKSSIVVLYCGRDFADQAQDAWLYQKITDGLYSQLACEFPGGFRSITRKDAEAWRQTDGVLFRLGHQNVRKKYTVESSWENMGGTGLWFFWADHHFVPNIIFDLENDGRLWGPHGALVGLPRHGNAFIHPIESFQAVSAMNILAKLVSEMYEDGSHLISPDIYWYQKKFFTVIPYRWNNDKLDLFPPDSLMAILNQLRTPQEASLS